MTEEQIIRLYGKRCAEHCDDCCVCEVWAMHDLIETQAREIERLRGALEREPKAWLIEDEETAWVTLFEPNPKDHPWGEVIPLYSAALAGDSHDQ